MLLKALCILQVCLVPPLPDSWDPNPSGSLLLLVTPTTLWPHARSHAACHMSLSLSQLCQGFTGFCCAFCWEHGPSCCWGQPRPPLGTLPKPSQFRKQASFMLQNAFICIYQHEHNLSPWYPSTLYLRDSLKLFAVSCARESPEELCSCSYFCSSIQTINNIPVQQEA